MNTKTKSNKYLVLNNNSIDIEITGTEGSYVFGANGKKYLDFTSGWCVGNLGWGQKEIKKAIKQYSGPDYVAPAFLYKPWADLAELLCELAPGNLNKVFRCTGGTEAVDIALQIAMAYTGRKKIISVEDSYHGNSIAARSAGASTNKEQLPALLPGMIKLKTPLDKSRINTLETNLRNKEVAAVLLEPVSINLCVAVHEPSFINALQRLCRKYGTLLIADEVACGFGRTGKIFACEHFELKPDILCLAKGISGGYGPLGATLTTSAIYSKIKDKVPAYSTFGWHPLAVAATLANVSYIKNNKDVLLKNVSEASQLFRTALSQLPFKKGGKISMIGVAIAIDLEDKKYAASVKQKCQNNGLLLTSQSEKLVMFPPLTITKNAIHEGLGVLQRSL